ncbi:MAG TPA: hypothetical protein VEZ11_12425, partial [Thermoanaerobaculia bacterium]|nr:hypothetical protein [Thermoanaerobaculia bacterium]
MRNARTVMALVLLAASVLCFPALAEQPAPSPIVAADTTATPEVLAAPDATATLGATADQGTPAAEPPKPPAAPTAIQIKVGDASFRFGLLLQPQADWQGLAAGGTSQNMFLRRTRFFVAGQVAKNVFFFYQTENSRLGLAAASGTKTLGAGFQTLDAVGEWRLNKMFNIWGGLIYVPTSREALKSSSSCFALDVSTYAFTASTALTGNAGRDTGMMARGYFLDDHLEYRAGVFQGLRESGSRNTFRKVARVQYNFFDTEVYNPTPAYIANYFGTKKIVALGGAYDAQESYKGYTADLYVDVPTAFGSIDSTTTFQNLKGGKFLPTALPDSNTIAIDGGLYLKSTKLGPWARYEQRDFSSPNSAKNERRYWGGINWFPYGNYFNVKAGVQHVVP